MAAAVHSAPAAAARAQSTGTSGSVNGNAVAEMDRDQLIDQLMEGADKREKFIPVTRSAIMDRLTRPALWPAGQAEEARRSFRYLDFWRAQSYAKSLLEMEQAYEALSPDSDLLVTRTFAGPEREHMKRVVVDGMERLMVKANFIRIAPSNVELILTKDSHYGLDLHVDLDAFEELLIFYRGHTHQQGTRRRFYVWRQQFEYPVFQRLFVLFKLKPEARRIEEMMRATGVDREEAEKQVKRLRSLLPPEIKDDAVYMKLFKNIPCSDLEMVFPNTKIRFRLFDKIKLGVSAGGGLGMGVIGTAGKIAVATNPIALAGAVAGLGGIALRQGVNFMNQRTRYMATMAQNLYFHSMADNRGVMTIIADRAAEEDIKEEMLLYCVLAKERVHTGELPDVDKAIEQYLTNTFGISVNFDLDDAMERLKADELVVEGTDGYLTALGPREAAARIDAMWDVYLDHLPDPAAAEGHEMDADGP